MKIIGTGDIIWKLEDINGKGITLKLKDVKLIPALKNNLLSLSQIFNQYKATELSRDKENIRLKIKNNNFDFKLKEKLFKNEIKKENSIEVNSAVKTTNISEDKFRMEHFRMAHLNSQDLAIVLRSKGFKIENKTISNFTCDECMKSKLPLNVHLISAQSPMNPSKILAI